MLEQLVNLNLFAFLLIFTRLGAAIMLMPGFGQQYVSTNVRLLFALMLSLVMTPVLVDGLPPMPGTVSGLGLLLLGESLIGAFLGLIPRIAMAALQTAGTILALVSSMANMFVLDPISEQQSSLLSTFLGTLGITLVFVTDTHHLMLAAATESYSLFVPGEVLPVGDITDQVARMVSTSFLLGTQLASPLILTGVTYYVGLGILNRLMPQLPVFFFGLPAQISMQYLFLMITIPAMMIAFMHNFEDGLVHIAMP